MNTALPPFPLADGDPTLALLSQEKGLAGGRGVLIAFVLLWAAWSGLLGWTRVTHPGLDHGDITTDANILNAGENFDREGFWASCGVPALDTFRASGQGSEKTPDHYVTYPPGCYWLHQGLKALGLRELWHFRLAAVVWSSLAVLLFFVLCVRVTGAILPAAVGAGAYMLSRPFGEYADNLHYLSFSQVTLLATLLAWVAVERARTSRARMRWLIVAAACFAVDCAVTFEHTLFVGAFGLVRILLLRRWGLLFPLVLLGLVPVLVLAARMAVNAAAVGGLGDVWALMLAKLDQRTGRTGGATWPDMAWAMLDRLGWPGARSPTGSPNAEVRIGVLSPAFLAPACVLAVISLATWHLEGLRPARRAAGLALALLIGGATWSLVMREHALVHRFTVLLLLPGISAAIGALVTFGWMQWRLQPRGAPVRIAGCVAGCALLVGHVAQLRHAHALNIAWRLDRSVHEANRTRAEFEQRFADASLAFAGVKRLYMHSHDAQIGRKLGVPFDNAVGVVRAPLTAGESQMMMWTDSSVHAAVLDAVGTLGPPRLLSPPAGHLAFFFPSRAQVGAAGIGLADETRITRLWLEQTLDGGGMVIGAVAEVAPGATTAGLAMHVRLLDASGRQIGKHVVFADSSVIAPGRAAFWIDVESATPDADESRGGAVEVWWTRDGRGRLSVLTEGLVLPVESHTKLKPGGRVVVLEAP